MNRRCSSATSIASAESAGSPLAIVSAIFRWMASNSSVSRFQSSFVYAAVRRCDSLYASVPPQRSRTSPA
ncbi:hypothetical protein SRIMM317S_01991 [Streptomyces rimosus subsp. rimosus]